MNRVDVLRGLAAAPAIALMPDFAGAQSIITPKIALNWVWEGRFMPLRYGEAKGYFKAAGVAPDYLPILGSAQPLQLIETSKVDYALTSCDLFLTAAAQNKTTSKAVYVWIDRPTFCLVTLSPLVGPAAMAGKTFGTVANSSAVALLPYVLQLNKVDPHSVKVQILDFSVLYQVFLRGDLDTVEVRTPGSWAALQEEAAKLGKKLYLTRMSDWGLAGYDTVILARAELLRDSPQDVKRTIGVFDRSLKDALAHGTDADAYAVLKDVIPQTSESAIIGDWHDYKSVIRKPGPIDPKMLEASVHQLQAVGQITSMPPLDSLYVNQVR